MTCDTILIRRGDGAFEWKADDYTDIARYLVSDEIGTIQCHRRARWSWGRFAIAPFPAPPVTAAARREGRLRKWEAPAPAPPSFP